MNEQQIIRDLAKEVYEFSVSDTMEERRKLWSNHNSLEFTKPPIYIRAIPLGEIITPDMMKCETPYYRNLERSLLVNKYRMQIEDDYIIEPYMTVRAALTQTEHGIFGLPDDMSHKTIAGGAAAFKPSILEEEDIEKINVVPYEVDEEETQRRLIQAQDTFDGTMPIAVDRQGTLCQMWNCDISTTMAKLRGMEQIMWDIYDRPEWLLDLATRMQQKILKNMDETQAANGFRLLNHQNQAMSYANELQRPSADDTPVTQKDLWLHMASQEFTTIGPDDFKEFMFDLQKPIMERYGLVAYGCCEDLTRKIDVIKSVKNLRRIAVSPFSDLKKCAEQIGSDYVVSYRPDPSSAVSRGIDEAAIRSDIRNAFDILDANHCKFDITLKDVETVAGDRKALIQWTHIIRDEINKRYC